MSQFSGDLLSRLSQFGRIYLFETINSTQIQMRKLAKEIPLDGHYGIQAIVIANQQTQGLGRLGRSWYSPENGLYFSLLVNFAHDKTPLTLLTLYTGKIIADVIEELTLIPIYLKWPNDLVYIDNNYSFYKVGGILSETIGKTFLKPKPDKKTMIIGIGLNINQTNFPDDLAEATSLKLITLKTKQKETNFNQGEILYKILNRLSESLFNDTIQSYTEILQEIKHKSSVIGKRVKVSQRFKTITGTAIDIDEQGRLILRTEVGRIISLDAGEVSSIRQ
ncbi:MAG: biotin--[acetyl-CoA-carboxylase] ligase [candidate division WOR-3 bacterium]